MGRPFALDDPIVRGKFFEGLEAFRCDAGGLSLAEITWDALNRYRERCRSPDATPEQKGFLESYNKLWSKIETSWMGLLMNSGRKDWRKYAFLLERRFPERYSREQRIEVSKKEPSFSEMLALCRPDKSEERRKLLGDEAADAFERKIEAERQERIDRNRRLNPPVHRVDVEVANKKPEQRPAPVPGRPRLLRQVPLRKGERLELPGDRGD